MNGLKFKIPTMIEEHITLSLFLPNLVAYVGWNLD